MSTLTLDTDPLAVDLSVDSTALRVVLSDGCELSVPVGGSPGFATPARRPATTGG